MEANLLDGDSMDDWGCDMVNARECFEVIRDFFADKIEQAKKEAVMAYDSVLELKKNCKEMDRIEQYFAGFKKTIKISTARRQALAEFGIEDK